MFDPAPRRPPQISQNNYLFEKVEVRANDSESRGSSVRDGQSPLPASASNTKDKPFMTRQPTSSTNVKERLRSLQRVWTAMTKFVASQTGSGRTVDLPLAGKFKKIKRTEDEQREAEKMGAAI